MDAFSVVWVSKVPVPERGIREARALCGGEGVMEKSACAVTGLIGGGTKLLLKSTSVEDEPELMGGDGGRGGKDDAIPDERRGGGLTLAGNGTELKRLL